MQMFMVGGAVRDELLGVPSKDIDFTVVMDFHDAVSVDPFKVMVGNLKAQGFEIFLETPEFLTVRARFPKNHEHARLTADFVLARKESEYTDGRRPDKVIPGTLEDDLARRDFTMNAVARDSAGNLIDPFDGQDDIAAKVIRCVGEPWDRITEDALRALRAIRFAVTKGFSIDSELWEVIDSYEVADIVQDHISDERIQVELSKMFRFNTPASIEMLNRFPALMESCFAGDVSLDATMKTKGKGK